MADTTHNAIALFVQDCATKATLSQHVRHGCSFQQAAVISKAFATAHGGGGGSGVTASSTTPPAAAGYPSPSSSHSPAVGGDVVVLHKYRCQYVAVGEVIVVGVCLSHAHPHPTLRMAHQAATLLRTILKDKPPSGITAAALRKRNVSGEVTLSLAEVLHHPQVGAPGAPPEHHAVAAGRAFLAPPPYLAASPAAPPHGGDRGSAAEANVRLLRCSAAADRDTAARTKAANFSMEYAEHPPGGEGEEGGGAAHQLDLSLFLPGSGGGGGGGGHSHSQAGRASRGAAAAVPSPAEGGGGGVGGADTRSGASSPDAFDFMNSPAGASRRGGGLGGGGGGGGTAQQAGPLDDIFAPSPAAARGGGVTPPSGAAQPGGGSSSAGGQRPLDDLFGGGSQQHRDPGAGQIAPPALAAAPRDAQLSCLVQETVSATFSGGEGSGWALVGDVLLMGPAGLAPVATPSEAPAGEEERTEVVFVKFSGPATREDVRPNPEYAQLVDEVRLIFRVRVRHLAAGTPRQPVCVLKYRQVASAAPVYPLKTKLTWSPMPRAEPAELLEQVTLQWAANPWVKLAALSFAVSAGSAVYSPSKQQSKPAAEWDAAAGILVWNAMQAGQAVAPAKLQARLQCALKPSAEPDMARHEETRPPVTVRFHGAGSIGDVSVAFFSNQECTTPAVLKGGMKTKFVSSKSFTITS